MTDMIRTNTTNIFNHTSAAEEVLNRRLITSHRSIGISAKELTCSPCMVMLSVIMSYTDNFIGTERVVLWGFLAYLQPFFHYLRQLTKSYIPPQLPKCFVENIIDVILSELGDQPR